MQTQISNKIALESGSVDLKISIRKLICAKWVTLATIIFARTSIL